jgi:hypothetical protein
LPASDKDASSLACAWKRHAAGIALGTVVGALAYLGLAIFGWGGFGDFFSHPARVVLVVTVVVLAGAAPFTRGNLSPRVREDHIYLNEVDWYTSMTSAARRRKGPMRRSITTALRMIR